MSNKLSILIVDDEKNIRRTLDEALKMAEYETDTALDGEEALVKITDNSYSLILLDLKMPGIDGMEVLRRTREIRPETKVVVITAHGTVDSAVEAMKLGAADFVQKPFTPQEIRDLVRHVIEHHPLSPDKSIYDDTLAEARRLLRTENHEVAIQYIRRAIWADPFRPEAFNLLGVALHNATNKLKALDYFRVALTLDGSYSPARENLHHLVSDEHNNLPVELLLGDENEE